MAKVAYFDCFMGLTGSMALAALLDAGLDRHTLEAEVRKVFPMGWTLHAERAIRHHMAGTDIRITRDNPAATHDLATLLTALERSGLDVAVQQRSFTVLQAIATFTGLSTMPLHAALEVVAVVVGLAALGVEQIYAALPLSAAEAATHRARHILEPLLDGRVPLFDAVGAALLAEFAVLERPAMALHSVGYGLHSRDLPILDAVRVWIGDGDPQPQATDPGPTMMSTFAPWMGASTSLDSPTTAKSDDVKADAVLLIDDGQGADPAAYADLAQALQGRLGMAVYVCWTDGQGVRATVEACMARGELRLVIAPLFRTPARRTIAELRGMLGWVRDRWPGSAVAITNPVWTPDHLLDVLARHADAALSRFAQDAPGPTVLLVVASPSPHEDENAEWFRLARLLWERRRDATAWVDVGFSHGTQPSVAAALQRYEHMGAERVVVLPTTLLRGTALDQIAAQVHAAGGSLGERVVIAPALSRVATATALIAQRVREALERPAERETLTHHGHSHVYTWDSGASSLLPPRYQGGQAVSAAPMGAADLVYGDDGRVAWDAIWTDFCDLALAGGPPHRDDLLEPADPGAVAADPTGYARVLDELRRGLRMVTGLPVVDGASGWIGVRCDDDRMALWMLRAIVVENVSVRREGATLFLPAGPHFRLAHEIKNVITAVAKTHHYWTEHANG